MVRVCAVSRLGYTGNQLQEGVPMHICRDSLQRGLRIVTFRDRIQRAGGILSAVCYIWWICRYNSSVVLWVLGVEFGVPKADCRF